MSYTTGPYIPKREDVFVVSFTAKCQHGWLARLRDLLLLRRHPRTHTEVLPLKGPRGRSWG